MLVLGAVGCTQSDDGDTTPPDDGATGEAIKVGLVQINQQAIFFNQMNEGAQEAADELGVDLTIFNANDDPAKQNEAITNFVTQDFDAIIVVAIDVEGVKPAIREAADAGVKIVAVDAVVEDPAVSVQVGVDNAAAGAEIGEFVVEYMTENNVEPKNIGVLGALNSFIQNLRKDAFIEVVEAAGATITQTVDGQNRQEAAMAAAENLFTAQADTAIMYATGEPQMVGAVAAVRSQNRGTSVKLFGWDLTAEVIRGIDDGFVLGVVQQDPKTEGYEAVKACKTLAEGGTVEAFIDVPITIVTKDNVDPYREIFK
jgi:ribose transport system substrate-binding protein